MSAVSELLVKHAYSNIWAGPRQDTQYIIAPSRITARRGVLGKISLGLMDYTLPSGTNRYSVFVLGDIPPFMVGMREYVDRWVTAEAHCNSNSLVIEAYNQDGIRYPLHLMYFLQTRGGQLAIALRHINKGFDVSEGDVYIRWRSASWFERNVTVGPNAGITIKGMKIETESNMTEMVSHLASMKLLTGLTTITKNGRRIRAINTTTVKQGDYVEIVQDRSVRKVIEIPFNELLVFDSIRDLKSKYLITQEGYGTTIDYEDDVDINILYYSTPAVYDGVYFHHNHVDSYRNVTHRDWSIPTAYVNGILNKNPTWVDHSKIKVEVVIRHSGFVRDLTYTNNRIFELFRLPHTLRLEAMVGEKATLTEWNASQLESDAYPRMMRTSKYGITSEMCTSGYGYNAVSRILGYDVLRRDGTSDWLHLKPSSFEGVTVYEYNHLGTLLDYHTVENATKYPIQSPVASYFEILNGVASDNMGTMFDLNVVDIPDGVDFRAYISDKWSDQRYGDWVDVTGDLTKYSMVDGKLTWLVDKRAYKTAVRTDQSFMSVDFEIARRDKTMLFTIVTDGLYIGRGPLTGWLEIPPGEIDVFLNEALLVEGVEYHVSWPEICIVSKSQMVNSLAQKVTVRARGFCNSDLSRQLPRERGFIYDRIAGKRDRYYSRDDKLNTIHIAGRIFTYDEVFESDGSPKILPSGYDRLPYQIKNPYVSMDKYIDGDTFEYRSASINLDNRMENYVSIVTDHPGESEISTISGPFAIISPVANKLMHDLLDGVFPIDEFKDTYSIDFLLDKLKRYDWLLNYDPCIIGYDEAFVVIHPHSYDTPIELNIYQYRIMDLAVQHYLHNKVSMDRNLVIVEEGFEHDTRYHPHPRRVLP